MLFSLLSCCSCSTSPTDVDLVLRGVCRIPLAVHAANLFRRWSSTSCVLRRDICVPRRHPSMLFFVFVVMKVRALHVVYDLLFHVVVFLLVLP